MQCARNSGIVFPVRLSQDATYDNVCHTSYRPVDSGPTPVGAGENHALVIWATIQSLVLAYYGAFEDNR